MISLLTVNNSFSQSGPIGARAAAMGHGGLMIKDIWGIYNNQAVPAFTKGFELGVSLENRYMMKEMNRISLGVAKQLGKGGLFAGIDHFGDGLYGEMKASAGYALQLGSRVGAGLQLDYLHMSVGDGYGSYHAFTFEGGLLVSITDRFSLGLQCFNPVNTRWTGTGEHLPVMIRGGFSYKPESSIIICGEILKSTAMPAVISAGCEYGFREKVFFRAGVSSGPARLTFGAGIRLRRLMIDIASSMHAYLGFSPLVSFTYGSK